MYSHWETNVFDVRISISISANGIMTLELFLLLHWHFSLPSVPCYPISYDSFKLLSWKFYCVRATRLLFCSSVTPAGLRLMLPSKKRAKDILLKRRADSYKKSISWTFIEMIRAAWSVHDRNKAGANPSAEYAQLMTSLTSRILRYKVARINRCLLRRRWPRGF